jgi:hypothetical protein
LSKEKREIYIDINFKNTFEKIDQIKKEMETDLIEPGYILRWRPLKKKGIMASFFKMRWDDKVKLLDWFYARLQGACYRDELKMRSNYSEEIKLLKRAEGRIVKRNPKSIVVLRHMFFPEERFSTHKSLHDYQYINGIKFGKDTIEMSIISKENENEFLIESKFVNSKPHFRATIGEIKPIIKHARPYICFPTGQKISIAK